MVKRNPSLTQLQESYLFEEIAKRKARFAQEELINLGIGDTTEPLPLPVVEAIKEAASKLGCVKSYSGYESYCGRSILREAIAHNIYHDRVSPDEIFISDGSKCDLARLQQLFPMDCRVALQDPSYPAYIGANKINGKQNLVFIPCTPKNNFCPDPSSLPESDLLYLCSPNNPTGHVMNHQELQIYVEYAQKRRSIIIFDSAYSAFIQEAHLPRSIYEIEGSKEVAIETGSFSKMCGFTGVRLGWLVIPKTLTFEDGSSLRNDWIKISSTCFNGASNLAQAAGLAALANREANQIIIQHYMENARLLRHSLSLSSYGGENAPYLWVDLQGKSSWEVFDHLLYDHKIVTTPGVGFGVHGEGFLRISAFAKREQIQQAMNIFNLLRIN